MKKLEEYRLLNKNVRAARKALHAAQTQITETIETPNWENYSSVVKCINRYSKMTMPWFAKTSFEDIEFVRYCKDYNCHHLCENNNCEYQEQNWDVVAAQVAYDNAKKERRAFVRGLFVRTK